MDTINAVKDEMRLKQEYMNEIMTNYPIMAAKNNVDPDREVHNYNIVELKIRFKQFIQNAKVDKAARLIQYNWRAAKKRERDEIERIREEKATEVIKRCWKNNRWHRLLKTMNWRRKMAAAKVL